MRVSQRVLEERGVQRATLLMGTPANKAMLAGARLMRPELDDARPADLMIVVEAESSAAIDGAIARIAALLDSAPAAANEMGATPAPSSIALAMSRGARATIVQ